MESSTWIGRRVAGFLIEGFLGRGAHAEVYEAVHVGGERVALKIARDAGHRLALEQEAERLASLDHPGIVHAYDAGQVDGRPWVALELAGGTLADLASPLEIGALAEHLLGALAHLHARGWIHCDLKPSNILIGCSPRTGLHDADRFGIRIADFGISWVDGGRQASGTPRWAAPEQVGGAVRPSTDLYALALVLQAIVGSASREALGPWLSRALRPDPDERFPTAAHALAALPRGLGRLPATAWPVDGDAPVLQGSEQTLPTVTRALLVEVAEGPSLGAPLDLIPPPWPETPPVHAARVPRARLLDAGMRLLPHRAQLPWGRLRLLQELWSQAREGPLELEGAEDDLDEVEGWLTRWATEVGQTLEVRRGSGTKVPALVPWQLEARAMALGFEEEAARRMVRGSTTGKALRARILAYVGAGLVQTSERGLRLVSTPEVEPIDPAVLEEVLLDAWWTGDHPRHADAVVALMLVPETPRVRALLRLNRERLTARRGEVDGLRLEAWAQEAPADVALQMHIEAISIYCRGRWTAHAQRLLDGMGPVEDERWRAILELRQGYVLLMQQKAGAAEHFHRARGLAQGRYDAWALAFLTDERLAAGDVETALEFARLGVERCNAHRPEEALGIHMALVNALVASKAAESEVGAVLERAEVHVAKSLNHSSIGRFLLFKGQAAMRRKDWDHANHFLSESAAIFQRSGGRGVFLVLNHGLVGLARADLASVAAITPPDWAQQTAAAPAYVQRLMQLHAIYARLHSEDVVDVSAAVDALLEGGPLPSLVREGLLDAMLAAPEHGEALERLLDSTA